MNDHPDMDPNVALQEFMAEFNNLPFQQRVDESIEYFNKAVESTSTKTKITYLKKALELDPGMLDAKIYLVDLQSKTQDERRKGLRKLLAEEKKRLKEEEHITEEENVGDFYMLLLTRGYIPLMADYMSSYFVQAKYGKAAEICQRILYLNSSDNLGIRYTLMGIYAMLEQKENAKKLYERFPEVGSYMLLPLLALYYKLEEKEAFQKYAKIWKRENKYLSKGFRILKKKDLWEAFEIKNGMAIDQEPTKNL